MTPAQELALLQATAAGLDDEIRQAFAELVRLIQAGTEPREAVAQVMASFQGEMADTMATALSGILGQAVGGAEVMAMQVGAVQLSRKLWAEGLAVSETVEGLVRRHADGFLDARRLALELFEGYAFREPGAEPLQFNTSNPRLPKYLREALMPDEAVRSQIARAFARLQVDGLATGPLRAAYQQVLDALDGIEDAAGAKLLKKRLDVAFYERMRYFAARIARTELHRAYAYAEAQRLMNDADVEYLQVRRVPGGQPCICTLFAGRDLYGLGAGVYPKALCPLPPYHPFCQCVTSPRLDLTGKKSKPRDPNGDQYFLNRLQPMTAARVMGSQAKRDRVLTGAATPEQVVNAGRDLLYHVKTVGQG
ncbi:MAG: hypothetical protein KAY54_03625 [Burkholderiaceae bacterium]|nr:hypothetical protein [Burkholderiaceae bacterium]